MAKYDQGGGCGCGLYAECLPNCEFNELNLLGYPDAHDALMALLRLPRRDVRAVLERYATIHAEARCARLG